MSTIAQDNASLRAAVSLSIANRSGTLSPRALSSCVCVGVGFRAKRCVGFWFGLVWFACGSE